MKTRHRTSEKNAFLPRHGQVRGFDLMLLMLLFFSVVVGLSLGVNTGERFGFWGKVIGGVLGAVVAVPSLVLVMSLLFLILEPFGRLGSRFMRWWRPYPPVCENGCCQSYSDYWIPEEIYKRVEGMARSGYQCGCGDVYVVGCDFPMLNRFARLLPDGTVRPYLRHRFFGRWRPDDGKGIVYLTGDEEAVEVPGWVVPITMVLIFGGISFYVVYVESGQAAHPLAPWCVGTTAVLGFVAGCVGWWWEARKE